MMLNQIRSSRNILNTYLGRLMALEIEEPDVPNVENQTFTQPRAANDSATQKVRDELELVQEELERLVNDTDQIETRQQTLETDLQRVVRQIEQLGMDPGELGNAVDAMDNAESELSSNSPATAIPEQARAMQALREGQEQLQEQMQQQQQQQQQSSGGSQPSQSGSDGQGSPQFSTGIVDGDGQVTPNISNPNIELGIDPEANPNLSRDIRDQIRQRLTEEGMTPLERQYLEGLLTERPSQGSSVIPSVRPPRP